MLLVQHSPLVSSIALDSASLHIGRYATSMNAASMWQHLRLHSRMHWHRSGTIDKSNGMASAVFSLFNHASMPFDLPTHIVPGNCYSRSVRLQVDMYAALRRLHGSETI